MRIDKDVLKIWLCFVDKPYQRQAAILFDLAIELYTLPQKANEPQTAALRYQYWSDQISHLIEGQPIDNVPELLALSELELANIGPDLKRMISCLQDQLFLQTETTLSEDAFLTALGKTISLELRAAKNALSYLIADATYTPENEKQQCKLGKAIVKTAKLTHKNNDQPPLLLALRLALP